MLVTAEKAKKCWCPHARMVVNAASAPEPVFNRMWVSENKDKKEAAYLWSGEGCHCIANGCMAWNWATEKPIQDIDLVTGDVEKTERLGYCGLSGIANHED